MVANQRGGLASGINGHLCLTLCRVYIQVEGEQLCEGCTLSDKCEAMVDEILTYLEDQHATRK